MPLPTPTTHSVPFGPYEKTDYKSGYKASERFFDAPPGYQVIDFQAYETARRGTSGIHWKVYPHGVKLEFRQQRNITDRKSALYAGELRMALVLDVSFQSSLNAKTVWTWGGPVVPPGYLWLASAFNGGFLQGAASPYFTTARMFPGPVDAWLRETNPVNRGAFALKSMTTGQYLNTMRDPITNQPGVGLRTSKMWWTEVPQSGNRFALRCEFDGRYLGVMG